MDETPLWKSSHNMYAWNKKKMLRFDNFSFERSQDSRRTAFTEVQITSQAQINSAPDEGEPH